MPNPFEVTLDRAIEIYDEAGDQAEADVIKMGLPLAVRPIRRDGTLADSPQPPIDLSEARYAELTTLIGQFTAWYSYAISQLKIAEGERNRAQKKRDVAWSHIRQKKDGTVSDKDDAARLDKRFLDVDAHYEYCDSKVRHLTAITEGYKREIETVSRAFSALDGKANVEGRGATFARKRSAEVAGDAFKTSRRSEQPHESKRSALDVFKKGRR